MIAPKDKERYARSAAPEAIRAELRIAQDRHRRAGTEVMWLETLLAEREQQVAAGTWPPKGEPDRPPAAGEAVAYLTIACHRCGYGGTDRAYEDQDDGTWLCSACPAPEGEQ